MSSDIRIRNAKVRLQERGVRVNKGIGNVEVAAKMRLEELEEQTLKEDDPKKMAELFENYRKEYLKVHGEMGMVNKKQKTEDKGEEDGRGRRSVDDGEADVKRRKTEYPGGMEERAGGSGDVPQYMEKEVRIVGTEGADPWDLVRKAHKEEKEDQMGDGREVAWDDVNDIELPVELVRAGRRDVRRWIT